MGLCCSPPRPSSTRNCFARLFTTIVWLPTGVEFEAVAVAIAGCEELTARALRAPAGSLRASTALERAVTSVFSWVSAELCPCKYLLLSLPDLLWTAQVGDQLVDRRGYVDSLPCAQARNSAHSKCRKVAMS